MKAKLAITLTALTVLTLSSVGHTNDLDRDDTIFKEPQRGGWSQVFLGLGEVGAATVTWPKLMSTPEGVAVKAAQEDLRQVHLTTFTSEKEKATALRNEMHHPKEASGYVSRALAPSGPDYYIVKNGKVVSASEKAQIVKAAEEKLVANRARLLNLAKTEGLLRKTVKIARVGTSILLIGDVAARVYVWDSLKANPTFSPVSSYIQHQLK